MPSDHVGRVAGTAAAIALLVCLGLLSNRSWSPPLMLRAAPDSDAISQAVSQATSEAARQAIRQAVPGASSKAVAEAVGQAVSEAVGRAVPAALNQGLPGCGDSSSSSRGGRTKQEAAPGTAASSTKQYSMVLAGTHHKTGSVLLMCLSRAIKRVAGVRVEHKISDVTAADISAARAAAQASPGSPGLFSTYLPLAQECYAQGSDKEWFRCPVAQTPCTRGGAPTLSLDSNCFISLPVLDMAVVHFVRSPLDIVVSAFWFHTEEVPPEEWIKKEFRTRVDIMRDGGVPLEQLRALGLREEHDSLPYGQLLRSLPEEDGVQLEFWRSAPGMFAMARQYLALQRHPAPLQLKYEAVMADFNATVSRLGRDYFPQAADAILEASQECDVSSWTSKQLSASSHVTASKHPAGSRQRLQGVLLRVPVIRRHLCDLCAALDYDEPRCSE